MNIDMFPNNPERELQLRYNLNGSYTLDRVKETVDKVEDYLYDNMEKFEIESVYTYYQPEYAQSTIILVDEEDAEKSVEFIKEEIEKDLPVVTIGEPAFEFRSRNNSESIRVYVQGESMDVLTELAEQVEWRISQVEGFTDVKSDEERGKRRSSVNHRFRKSQNHRIEFTSCGNISIKCSTWTKFT